MYHPCELCSDLWRRYGIATAIHIRLEEELRSTARQNELNQVETLTREIEGAELIRSDVRQSIREHEATHCEHQRNGPRKQRAASTLAASAGRG
jgi:hypothetical protein